MNIRFLGVGAASSTAEYYQSNLLISSRRGRRLLLDCGGDIRFSLAECAIPPQSIEAVYISHLHADHIGGLEWLAFLNRFGSEPRRPQLYCEAGHMERLWQHALRAGLECVDAETLSLGDYFDCRLLWLGEPFDWDGIGAEMVKMPHVIAGRAEHPSYGLILREREGPGVFITTDARYNTEILLPIAERVEIIFHDCETCDQVTGVHAHYRELLQLPDRVRAKIWLYHYQPAPHIDPRADGFLGFVTKGQEFVLGG